MSLTLMLPYTFLLSYNLPGLHPFTISQQTRKGNVSVSSASPSSMQGLVGTSPSIYQRVRSPGDKLDLDWGLKWRGGQFPGTQPFTCRI